MEKTQINLKKLKVEHEAMELRNREIINNLEAQIGDRKDNRDIELMREENQKL